MKRSLIIGIIVVVVLAVILVVAFYPFGEEPTPTECGVEGESLPALSDVECCEGLTLISNKCDPDIEECPLGTKGICTANCGNRICDETIESSYNCLVDCGICVDKCGDGECQEVVCLMIGCTCAETAESCPEDCEESGATEYIAVIKTKANYSGLLYGRICGTDHNYPCTYQVSSPSQVISYAEILNTNRPSYPHTLNQGYMLVATSPAYEKSKNALLHETFFDMEVEEFDADEYSEYLNEDFMDYVNEILALKIENSISEIYRCGVSLGGYVSDTDKMNEVIDNNELDTACEKIL